MNPQQKRLYEAALKLAKKGIPSFPTDNKKPCWSNAEAGVGRGEGGFKLASTDPASLKELFSHPRATELSVPMGEMSGLLCFDVDTYKDPKLRPWAAETLPATLIHETRSGGLHYIYKHPGNESSFPATLSAGVDLKAGGTGYICWPGTDGYTALNKKAPAAFPLGVVEQALKDKGGTGRMTAGTDAFNAATDDDLIGTIQDGTDFYASLRTLSWRMVGRGHSVDVINETLRAIMDSSVGAQPGHARYDDWLDRYEKIEDLTISAIDKNKIPEFSPDIVAGIMEGETFIRPTEPQPAVTQETIKKRVAALPASPSSQFERIDAQSLMKETIPPIPWIIPRVIPTAGIVSLGGSSGVGKTRWLAALVTALAAGKVNRLGLPPGERAVSAMWVANEEKTEDIKRRVKADMLQHGDKESLPIFIRGKDKEGGAFRLIILDDHKQPVIDEEAVATIVHEALLLGVDVIILDPYITLAAGIDENSAAVAALLTEVFTTILNLTGAAILHAHHTPKDRSKDGDWYRGDPSAWRGSGAIYSGLDAGLTLAPWMPRNFKQRKTWKAQTLSGKLSRWIVLDTGKLREGEGIDPVVYEMMGQEMRKGEGDPIAVCRLADAAQAENCLLAGAVDVIAAGELAQALFNTLGYGDYPTPHKKMRQHHLWPTQADRLEPRHFEKLMEMFETPVMFEGGSVSIEDTGKKAGGKYVWHINQKDKE